MRSGAELTAGVRCVRTRYLCVHGAAAAATTGAGGGDKAFFFRVQRIGPPIMTFLHHLVYSGSNTCFEILTTADLVHNLMRFNWYLVHT